MTISVRLVNCANWDEDVKVMTSHNQEYVLRRGEVSPPIAVSHGVGKELRITVEPGRSGEPGYLGEVHVKSELLEGTRDEGDAQ